MENTNDQKQEIKQRAIYIDDSIVNEIGQILNEPADLKSKSWEMLRHKITARVKTVIAKAYESQRSIDLEELKALRKENSQLKRDNHIQFKRINDLEDELVGLGNDAPEM